MLLRINGTCLTCIGSGTSCPLRLDMQGFDRSCVTSPTVQNQFLSLRHGLVDSVILAVIYQFEKFTNLNVEVAAQDLKRVEINAD